jgi:hypothetical protein
VFLLLSFPAKKTPAPVLVPVKSANYPQQPMQPVYLARLSKPVQEFIHEVEELAGVDIKVLLDPKQNEGGTTGQGKLAVVINAQSIQLFAPTTGYFPDGAVRHEVLHVQRFHVEGVPKLSLADRRRME